MSKGVIQSTNDGTGSRQTVQSYQPIWMAHWMRPSSNSKADRRDDCALDRVSVDEDLTKGLEASRSVKEPLLIDTKTETASLRMSSKGLGNDAMCSSLMKHGEDIDETKAIRPIFSYNLELGNAMECKGRIESPSEVSASKKTSFTEYYSTGEGTSMNPLEWVKTYVSAKNMSPSISTSFLGSSIEVVPYHRVEKNEIDKGKAVVCPLLSKPSIVSNNQFPNTSMNACFTECNRSLLLDAPTMKDLPTIRQDWLQKMQSISGISLQPNQNIASQKKESKILHYDNYSAEATAAGCPWFSQTTHSLFMTKNVEINISKEYDGFRSPSDVHNLLPVFGEANRGVKLQQMSSSSNSEGQGTVRDIWVGTSKVAIKNESSAETNTMDMEYLKEERPTPVANSSRSTKGFNFGTNLSPRVDAASSREATHSRKSKGLPDINLELPASPGSSENAGRSSSRTQSLDMDVLLAHAEHPTPKSNLSPNYLDPATRWVKRLKQTFSDSSGQGTKVSNLAEKSSYDKKRAFFRNVLKNSVTSSEPTPRKILGKEIMSGRSQKVEEEGKGVLLTHAWIKRWLRNGSQIPENKREAIVVCEPQTSKVSVDDFQKKQFPSIAAMALMGKAMGGYQSCELQKRGSLTVWNTKAF